MRNLILQTLESPLSFRSNPRSSELFACLTKNTVQAIISFPNVNRTKTPSFTLKWLLLIHKISLEEFKLNEWFYDLILDINIQSLESSGKSQPQKLVSAIIPSYLQYLKKRCMKIAGWVFDVPNSHQEILQQCYQIINLIKTASVFNNLYYTFGRYFRVKYGMVEDFNILMAKDISQVYGILKQRVDKLLYRQEDSGDLALLCEEIESMNEGLNYLYYNNYYADLVRRYSPDWIRFEDFHKGMRKMKSRKPNDRREWQNGERVKTIEGRCSEQIESIKGNIQRLKTDISMNGDDDDGEWTLDDISKELINCLKL